MGNLISTLKDKAASKKPSTSEKQSPISKMGDTSSSTPLKFSHYPKAQAEFNPPLLAHENHFLGDVFDSTDSEKPLSCGFYHFKPGTPLEYTYTYHEMKIILEGEALIRDATGQEVLATKGDVFYFPKGSVITFSTETPTGVKAFFCGQRAREGA